MAEPQIRPRELLEQLQASLEQNKQKSIEVTKEIGVLQSRVTDLTRITGEIEQKIAAYEKARSALEGLHNNIETFITAKKRALEDILQNKQAVIDEKKTGENQLQHLKTRIEQISNLINQRQDDLKAAQKKLDAAKSQYAANLDLAGSLAKELKELQNLEDLANHENDRNNFARMYFYILEMETKLTEAAVPTMVAYRNALEGAAASLARAIEDVRQKQEDLDKANAELETKQEEYEDAKAKRRQSTVTKIPEGVPPPPPVPPGSQ